MITSFICWECFISLFLLLLLRLLLAHQIQFRALRWLQTLFVVSVYLEFILRLLHFLCALEFVRLNFPRSVFDADIQMNGEKNQTWKTHFIHWHILITRRIWHTQIELFSQKWYSTFSIFHFHTHVLKNTENNNNNNRFSGELFFSCTFLVELNLCSNIIEYIYSIFVLCVGCCLCCISIV